MTVYPLTAVQIAAELESIEAIVADRGQALHDHAVKLAAKEKDEVVAKYLKAASNPTRIRRRVETIRLLIEWGNNLDEANQNLLRLRNDLDYLSQEVRRPIIQREAKRTKRLNEGGAASNAAVSEAATRKHQQWIAQATDVWQKRPELSATACAEAVIKKLKLHKSKGQVRKIIAAARPTKVGTAR